MTLRIVYFARYLNPEEEKMLVKEWAAELPGPGLCPLSGKKWSGHTK